MNVIGCSQPPDGAASLSLFLYKLCSQFQLSKRKRRSGVVLTVAFTPALQVHSSLFNFAYSFNCFNYNTFTLW